MIRTVMALILLAPAATLGAEDEIPEAFEPFAHMVGSWKGQAIPPADRLRGWTEVHQWAWAFEDGEPVAMTLDVEGGKVIDEARLSFDDASGTYRLEGTTPSGAPIAFVGGLDPETGFLVLDRLGDDVPGEDRLTIRPNPNKIRYDFWYDRLEPGAPQYDRLIRANLGKEGVSFAAGGAMARGPECIVTGGAATITVSAGGTTFAVCCTGCRDEVLENPEKYAQKLRARMASSGGDASTIRAGSGDGSFDLPSESPAADPSMDREESDEEPAPEPETADEPAPEPETGDEPEPEPDDEPAPDPEARRKAASLLRLGQALEAQGKSAGALNFYRRVVDDYPETPEASTARARIDALQGGG